MKYIVIDTNKAQGLKNEEGIAKDIAMIAMMLERSQDLARFEDFGVYGVEKNPLEEKRLERIEERLESIKEQLKEQDSRRLLQTVKEDVLDVEKRVRTLDYLLFKGGM